MVANENFEIMIILKYICLVFAFDIFDTLNYVFIRFGNSTILSNYVRHVVASEKAWSRSSLEEESPDDLLYLSGFCRGGI